MDTGTISVWAAKLVDICSAVGVKLILALLIFIIGRIVIGKILKVFDKIKAFEKIDAAVRSFLMNFIKIALYVILVISIISVLGVPMASVITVLATCGLALGMALQGALGNLVHEGLEVVAAGHEVGLALHGSQGDRLAVGRGDDLDQAFGGGAAGLLGGLGHALLAQVVDGLLEVAAHFDEGFLAVHHASAGLVTELFHHSSGNGHIVLLKYV